MTQPEATDADAARIEPADTNAATASVATRETPEATLSGREGIVFDEEATKALGGRGIIFKLPRPSFVPDPEALYDLIERHDLNFKEKLALYYQLPRWDGVVRPAPAIPPWLLRRPWEGR